MKHQEKNLTAMLLHPFVSRNSESGYLGCMAVTLGFSCLQS